MKLIKPYFEIINQDGYKIDDISKHIEKIGRICYKSEAKITEYSHIKFVDMLKSKQHGAMLEHGTVYMYLDYQDLSIPENKYAEMVIKYQQNKYSKTCFDEDNNFLITTNYRVIVENGWEDDLQYLCKPFENHPRRYSVKLICPRSISHEFVRNRGSYGNAFAQESTRYCAYNKSKFDNKITFIKPPWLENVDNDLDFDIFQLDKVDGFEELTESFGSSTATFLWPLLIAEESYFDLLKQGWQPQQAREVLPNALKTELIITSFADDWKHFFKLRCDSSAHPQARELAIPLEQEMKLKKFI